MPPIKTSILPLGYSIDIQRRKLEEQLRQARAAELARATDKERKRIEKEIKKEVDAKVREWRLPSRMWPLMD